MPATFAPSAAPPNALLIWTDGRSIYVELPSKPNVPPCIITYRLSEGGLSKALALLGKHADVAGTPQSLSRFAELKTMLALSRNMRWPNPSCERKGSSSDRIRPSFLNRPRQFPRLPYRQRRSIFSWLGTNSLVRPSRIS